jgi:putative flippase GtrA
MINMLLVFGDKSNEYSLIVVLAATSILWIIRVAMQVMYPQGSLSPILQYGVLIAFIVVSLCYLVSTFVVMSQKSVF